MSNTEKKQILRLALEIASISFKLRDELTEDRLGIAIKPRNL